MAVKKEISEALHRITHGVYVISTKHGKNINAMTAAWVARASFVPPLITVAIGKTRYSHDLIKDGGVFAVNILSKSEIDTGKYFGLTTGRKVDKFSNVPYDVKATGSPILKNSIAWLDCKVVAHHDAGDHTLFIGEVLDGGVLREEEPIVYKKDEFFK